jgi:hypothetical protein
VGRSWAAAQPGSAVIRVTGQAPGGTGVYAGTSKLKSAASAECRRRSAADRPSPGRVASTSVRRVDAQPTQNLPIACTLNGAVQAERLDQWRRLLARADRRERVEGGLRFLLPATLAGPAEELAAAEQRCCAFFAFTLRLADGGLELEVRAPAEALPLLTEVFGPARLFWRPRPSNPVWSAGWCSSARRSGGTAGTRTSWRHSPSWARKPRP